jgi:Tetratricopeptide repeat
LGPEHPNLAAPLHNLAELYGETGRPTEAEPLYNRVVAILKKKLPHNPYFATVFKDYADFLAALGRTAEAAGLRAEAETIRRRGS